MVLTIQERLKDLRLSDGMTDLLKSGWIFRIYQLNPDGKEGRVYKKYWDNSAVHFIEPNL